MKLASSMTLVCAFGAVVQAGATVPGQAATTPQQPAAAAERALVVVVDASGSMKEAVEGGLKHDLARRGLMKTLATLPGDSQVSLRLLGKGGDGECRASEQIIPFAPFDERRWDSTPARGASRSMCWRIIDRSASWPSGPSRPGATIGS